jgi:hypothetical protein
MVVSGGPQFRFGSALKHVRRSTISCLQPEDYLLDDIYVSILSDMGGRGQAEKGQAAGLVPIEEASRRPRSMGASAVKVQWFAS